MNPQNSATGPGFVLPAKKALGQHFLHERAYIDRIVQAVNPQPGDRLVEI
ncbi:MAG TPA: 16S rRNA (adenine(1518)-N(6)/adenine(1519)-N(6))-dimethyltransferase, partial [Xanthomonadaceae bacterium]|nr:16S rRNA (adenine(1518)-N(6)/adenine(1519)-N(6))-dimethyltransferase [Xanthomonadaceae bacterium]